MKYNGKEIIRQFMYTIDYLRRVTWITGLVLLVLVAILIFMNHLGAADKVIIGSFLFFVLGLFLEILKILYEKN